MFPIGGVGFRASAGISLNLNIGGPSPMGGTPCSCGGGFNDGFFPTAELSQGFGAGFSPFGGFDGYAAAAAAGSGMPDFTGHLNAAHPWAGGIGGPDPSLPAQLLMQGGGLPSLGSGLPMDAFGGGSLANQAMLMQAAASDRNQASLIGAQTGAFGGLSGAQGMALAGINPLMNGLAANYL